MGGRAAMTVNGFLRKTRRRRKGWRCLGAGWASLSPGQKGTEAAASPSAPRVSSRAPSLRGNSYAFSLSARTCFGGQMSQTASGGWDRGLVSLYQFLRSLPLSPSKPAPGCPLTLPPSGTSPRPASVRWAPLKGYWPQVQVGSRSPQLGLHGADWELQRLLWLQLSQSALCSGESGPLGFFTGADQGCLSHDCLAHSASRPPGPPWDRPSQDGLLAKAESQSLRANQVLFPVHLRGALGLF